MLLALSTRHSSSAQLAGLPRGYVDLPGLDKETETFNGYTVGAGVDFAFTDNIFVCGEYRFNDFGKKIFWVLMSTSTSTSSSSVSAQSSMNCRPDQQSESLAMLAGLFTFPIRPSAVIGCPPPHRRVVRDPGALQGLE
ncbi:outer membrane protein [Rhizobium sp. NZLR1]|uniref:outer membrane protein n=1 Tax=unclassified Rhizobium TaxID=2613769 RepID=UPI0038699A4F